MDWMVDNHAAYQRCPLLGRLMWTQFIDPVLWQIGAEDYAMEVVVQMTKDFKAARPDTGVILCTPKSETLAEFFATKLWELVGTSVPDSDSRPEQAHTVEAGEEGDEAGGTDQQKSQGGKLNVNVLFFLFPVMGPTQNAPERAKG